MKNKSNSPAKTHALKKGVFAATISLITYFFVVIITTPNLPLLTALSVAIKINWMIAFGLAIAIGAQVYVSTYAKNFGCVIEHKRKGILGSSGGTVLSSFFSFFSLVPLGCCGSWLLILSLLPSVFGSALSVILIQYSKPLAYLGLFIVIGYTVFNAIKLNRKLKSVENFKLQRKISFM